MKKGLFIVSVLLLSLLGVQAIVMNGAFTPTSNMVAIRPMEFEMKPVQVDQRDQFFIMDDHVIVLKDGKYYVLDRKKAT